LKRSDAIALPREMAPGKPTPMTAELKTLPDHVADYIRGAVLDGTYPPGARLIERKIASDVGVSHIPVREALAMLAEEGLVERLPHRGARVVSMDARKIDELSKLRLLLEQFVVECVQANWTPASRKELGAIVAEMVGAARSKRRDTLFALDVQFHQRLWEIADNSILLEVVSELRGRINYFLSVAIRALGPDESLEHAESHMHLLDAIDSGDRQKATSAMADHIETATTRIDATLGPTQELTH
jgi:DNA-binding GntR family transcriptional regulator